MASGLNSGHKNIHIKFYQAGHVLGSAICVIRIQVGRDEFMYIGFGGDLGRDSILLNAPKLVTEKLDYWVSESTYGDRSHPSLADESEFMFDVLRQVMRVGLGRVIIPALALHRSQEMIVTLVKAMQSGEIPRMPIYLHSKLAAGITAIYSKDWERLNKKAGLDFNPFLTSSLRVLNSDQDAKALMRSKEPMILVSSSGMCNAGPVRSYLRHWLGDAKTTVFLVSYMAENTLGKRLQDGSRTVHIDKEIVEVRARICSFKAFSGHADSQALTNYAAALVDRHSERVMRIFINHGTSLSAKYLKEKMIEAKIAKDQDITIPSLGAEYALNIEYKN
jgi:metallo-beta-lactamase family protein